MRNRWPLILKGRFKIEMCPLFYYVYMQTCFSLNICKEVVDGVRIYFDFTLSDLLLYNQEREQFERLRNQQAEPTIKQEVE